MFNKKKVLLLVSLATAMVCSATVQVGAFAANNSVQLNETPVIESTELKGSNFGNVSADFDLPDGWVYVYDANKTTYTSADIQVKQRGDLTLTPSNKIETLKQSTSDNQLKTHLDKASQMLSLLQAQDIKNYVDMTKLQSALEGCGEYVANGTVTANHLSLYKVFDFYFAGCDSLSGKEIKMSLDLTDVTTGIYAIVQFDGTNWTVVQPADIIRDAQSAQDGATVVTLSSASHVAILTVTQAQLDELKGGSGISLLWILVALAVVETGVVAFLFVKERALKG
jgi:hypothetical protein